MPPLLADRSFADRKVEGTAVEWLLLDLLTAAGMTVQPNQANWDEAANAQNAARAFSEQGGLHLPDLEAIAPIRMGFEVKSKEPRAKDGSIGWDSYAFHRAERWQEQTGSPVLYVIRDRSIAPLPASRSEPDNLGAWYCAGLHALRQSESDLIQKLIPSQDDGVPKIGATRFWPRGVFWPLADLLEGRVTVAPVLLRPKSGFGVSRLL